MNKYNSKMAEFQIPAGMTAIIGFQQVLTDPNKVFVWVRGTIDRPMAQDRHKTTKLVNNSFQRIEWAKSVWLISSVLKHFGEQLSKVGVMKEDFDNITNNELADKWETVGDGDRNFIKAVLYNPISEINGEYLNIQVTQHLGVTPESIYNRAFEEAAGNVELYNNLLTKYRSKAIIRTYAPSFTFVSGMVKPTRELTEVQGRGNSGEKIPVYETSEIVLGNPHHIFVDYDIPNMLPKDDFQSVQKAIELSMYERMVESTMNQQQVDTNHSEAIKQEFGEFIQ